MGWLALIYRKGQGRPLGEVTFELRLGWPQRTIRRAGWGGALQARGGARADSTERRNESGLGAVWRSGVHSQEPEGQDQGPGGSRGQMGRGGAGAATLLRGLKFQRQGVLRLALPAAGPFVSQAKSSSCPTLLRSHSDPLRCLMTLPPPHTHTQPVCVSMCDAHVV